MAEIELVIKIPEKAYNALTRMEFDANLVVNEMRKSIATGTPLPKGHGVLKDTDAMINKLCTSEASEFFGSVTCAEILDFINDEKPIIEADKAEVEPQESEE